MASTPAPRRNAIVIGSSMAGLLAARVLAGHYERVTVIERDALAPAPQPRKGVPQGRHVHALLIRGERSIGALFPDIVPALEAQGAVRFNAGNGLRAAPGERSPSRLRLRVPHLSRAAGRA